jgi:Concanavalin A-like lectin/glucanases superfamily
MTAVQTALAQAAERLLLLHFDGDLTGAGGEVPTQATGVTFDGGVVGQGVVVDDSDVLAYAAPALNPAAGTIELWVKPHWNGVDGQGRMFFSVGQNPQGPDLIVQKDGADNLVFIIGLPDSEAFQAYHLGGWQAGQWHHVAVTWSIPGDMTTYVDGVARVSHPSANADLISGAPGSVFVGNLGGSQDVDGVIDEVRVSGFARSAADIAASFLAGLSVRSLAIAPVTTQMYPGWQQTPTLTADTNVGTISIPARAATWTTSDPTVVTVDSSGQITAEGPGSATLGAAVQDTTATVVVQVLTPRRPPERGSVDPSLATPAPDSVSVVPVVIIRYLPTTDGTNLDVSFDPDYSDLGRITLNELRERIDVFDRRVKFMLEEGSRFHGYKDPAARPSIGYKVVDYITVYEPTPPGHVIGPAIDGRPVYAPDYNQILTRLGGAHYVNDLGVRQFWFWSGGVDPSFPSYDPALHTPDKYRAGPESDMSSPTTGDISNSARDPSDLPVYNHTYVLYGQNFRRTEAEAVHNRGHQLEAILTHVNERQDGNTVLFWHSFVGNNLANTMFVPGRCGDTHHPPNARHDYDYVNLDPVESDCEDWTPEGLGQKKPINALTWRDIPYDWPQPAPSLDARFLDHWLMYWMQNMPGHGSTIPYGPNRMTNWWLFTADWDGAIAAGTGLYQISPNLLANPGFELDADGNGRPDGWTVGKRVTRSGDVVRSGQYAARLTPPPVSFRIGQTVESVSGGTTYRVGAWIRPSGTPASRLRVGIEVRWLDAANQTIRTDRVPLAISAGPGWTHVGGDLVAPGTATRADYVIVVHQLHRGTTLYLDDAEISATTTA